jgi:hypothetical protein
MTLALGRSGQASYTVHISRGSMSRQAIFLDRLREGLLNFLAVAGTTFSCSDLQPANKSFLANSRGKSLELRFYYQMS